MTDPVPWYRAPPGFYVLNTRSGLGYRVAGMHGSLAIVDATGWPLLMLTDVRSPSIPLPIELQAFAARINQDNTLIVEVVALETSD